MWRERKGRRVEMKVADRMGMMKEVSVGDGEQRLGRKTFDVQDMHREQAKG